MLMPASASAAVTVAIMPGRSSLRTTSMLRRRRQVDGEVVDHHDARLALEADERAGDGVVAAADGDEVDVLVAAVDVDVVAPRRRAPRRSAAR